MHAAAQQVPASVAPGQIERQFEEPFEARATLDEIVVPKTTQEAPQNAADLTIKVNSITIDGATP